MQDVIKAKGGLEVNNEALVLTYQQGDQAALAQIIEKNKKIVAKVANSFYTDKSNAIDIEDLIQEGYIGLMIACKKYDVNNPKKAKFTTYAVYWIHKKMHQFIQRRQTNEELSLQSDEVEIQIKEETDYADRVERSLYYEEVREELTQLMDDELTLFEKGVTKLLYGWDGECVQLGDLTDIYHAKKKQIISARNIALTKMRNSSWGRRELLRREQEYYY